MEEAMREFARIGKVRSGDILEADGGFDCMKKGELLPVLSQEDKLYVRCKQGRHYLSGQESGHFYVGLYKVEK
jgi:hypothetical protein